MRTRDWRRHHEQRMKKKARHLTVNVWQWGRDDVIDDFVVKNHNHISCGWCHRCGVSRKSCTRVEGIIRRNKLREHCLSSSV